MQLTQFPVNLGYNKDINSRGSNNNQKSFRLKFTLTFGKTELELGALYQEELENTH